MGLHLDQCEQDAREQFFQGLTHLEANLYPRRLHNDVHSSHALQTLVTGLAEVGFLICLLFLSLMYRLTGCHLRLWPFRTSAP